MAKGLIGKKIGMTQVFDEAGKAVPVTVLEAGPCVVTQIKTMERDGYNAVQLGYGDASKKKAVKPAKGHFAKSGSDVKSVVAEIRVSGTGSFELGQTLAADVFAVGEKAQVTGISKGRGFAGVIKRWGFSGGPGGHGSHFHRAPGAVGMCATPSRVLKGKKLPGHYGSDRVTVRNLEVVRVDTDKNLLLLKGCVPGARGSVVMVKGPEQA